MFDGLIRRPSALLIIGPEEAGGAAAVIRAFLCGLSERKGHHSTSVAGLKASEGGPLPAAV